MVVDVGIIITAIATIALTIIAALLLLNRIAPGVVTEWLKAGWQSERDAISAERSVALESFKGDLQTALERFKTSISTLHEARASVISELYAALLSAWREWELALASLVKDAPAPATFDKAIAATETFRSIYFRSRLYLTMPAITLLSGAQTALESMRSASQLRTSKQTELALRTYDDLNAALTELQSQLEAEFRLILATEDRVQ